MPESGRPAPERIVDMVKEIEPHAQQVALLCDPLSAFVGRIHEARIGDVRKKVV